MVPTQRIKIPQGGAHLGVSQGHGAYGHPQSRCPLALHRLPPTVPGAGRRGRMRGWWLTI